jgi:hypothetical protein
LLIKPKEDLQLLKKQFKSKPALQEEQLNHQRDSLATESRLQSDPSGFFFAAMTPKRTLQGSESKGKLEAASATKKRAQLTAKTTDLICHGEVNHLAALSFGSGTECLAETYSEVERSDSLATQSLLQSDPSGFFFAAMTPKRRLQGSAIKGKLEAASSTKTRAQLTAKTTSSICHDAETYVLDDSEVE